MSDSFGARREGERRDLRVDHGVDADDLHLAFADLRLPEAHRRDVAHAGRVGDALDERLVGAHVRPAEDQAAGDEDEVRAERLVDVVEEARRRAR